ncbi:MAG TPA: zinc-ribbon domain-containing protein [Longimicrobium sp.]
MPETRKPADYRAMAGRRNAVWLGPEVRNANTRTGWECLACGRRWIAIYNSLQRGTGCPDCGVRRRAALQVLRPEAYHALAERRGFRWIGEYPGSARRKTEWRCGRGHVWRTTYERLAGGRGCPACAKAGHEARCARDRHRGEDYRAAGEKAGLEWLGPLPRSAHGKTKWRCRGCGREWSASFHKLTQGRACPRCRLDRRNAASRTPPERYHALAAGRGFKWLGPHPRQYAHHTRWRCPKGHEWLASYVCVAGGAGCHECQDRVNGMPVSGMQRRLADLLEGEINHRIGRRCIDVAVERGGVRIAAEYDAWYFHGGQQEKDEERDRALIARGWRVLRIRSAYSLPSSEDLEGAVARLVAGEERVVLTLPDWGVGPARGVAWEPSRPPRPYRRRHGGTHA